MDPVLTTIGLNVLGNLATDLLKRMHGQKVEPIEAAITSTANAFPALEGIERTLGSWLEEPRVAEVLNAYVEGNVAKSDVPIQELVSLLTERTQFYLPDHAEAVGEKLITTFLSKVRAAYLSDPQVAVLHIANRQELHFQYASQQFENIQNALETFGGLKPSLERRFKSALEELEHGSVQVARTMLQSLLTELEYPTRLPQLERSVHAKLGTALAQCGEMTAAVAHLRKAATLDTEDPVRATVNSAAADLLEQRYEQALNRLDQVQDINPNNAFQYFHAKAMALVGLKRFDEAIAVASGQDIRGNDEERHNLIGSILLHAGRFDEAAVAFEAASSLNPKCPESHFGAGEMILLPLVKLHNEDPFSRQSQQFVDQLERAARHLEQAGALFRAQGRLSASIHADEKLALARCLQERFAEAIQLLEPIVRETVEGRQDLLNLGFAFFRVNETRKAADIFSRVLSIEWDPNTERAYVQALIVSGQTQRALEFLSPRVEDAVSNKTLSSHLNLAEVHAARREYSRAKQVLEAVTSVFQDHPDVLITVAELNESTGNFSEASSAYIAALRNAVGPTEARVRFQYGRFCLNRKDFAKAVEVWRPLIRTSQSDLLKDQYLVALFNCRDYAEVFRISESVRASGVRVSPTFAEVSCAANEHLSNLEIARFWLEYLCDHDGNKPEHIVHLAQIELRLGHRDRSIDLLNATRASLTKPRDLLGYAKAYSWLDRPLEALNLAYKAAQLERSEEVHSGYVGAFLAAGDDKAERTPEQIALFQDILTNFRDHFPKAKQIQSFNIDPENPLQGIQELLAKHSEQVELAVERFKQQRLPLTSLAKAVGRDMYEVWLHCLGHTDLNIVCAGGTEEEDIHFQQSLTDASGLIVDTVSLFTLAHLGQLNKLKDFGDVYVAQQTLDYLHYMQSSRKIGVPKGTIGMVKGQFFMTEISAEEVKRANAGLDSVTDWVEHSAKITGFLVPLSKDEKDWAELLGDATLSTLAIAKQRSVILLTDDKALADLAKLTHGVAAVNSQALLRYLLNKGKLSRAEYDASILKLLDARYTFIRVEEAQIFDVLDQEDFELTEAVIRVLRVLESPNIELKSACAVVAGLLRRIYLEIIPSDIQEKLTVHMLNGLAKKHAKSEISELVSRFLRQQIGFAPPARLRKTFEILGGW